MEKHVLWSLRLGFSTREAIQIKSLGIEKFMDQCFQIKNPWSEPDFLADVPKTLQEFKEIQAKNRLDKNREAEFQKSFRKHSWQWKSYLLYRCHRESNAFQEKLNVFWSNHFVSTLRAVRVPYWIFKHHEIFHLHGMGNYKTLVKEILRSNALIKYLDNDKNKKGKINENLGRELLELFVLGEGNYSEKDIKNVSKSLAGLGFGRGGAQYYPFQKDNSEKVVLGEKGNFDSDAIVDILFKQNATSEHIVRKLMRWFVCDVPSEKDVKKYASYLRENDYELMPFFKIFFKKEYEKKSEGSQIKNPLVFVFQLLHELNIEDVNYSQLAFFLRNQGMDIYDQLNVKGWGGGKEWLSSQIFLDRSNFVEFILGKKKKYFKGNVENNSNEINAKVWGEADLVLHSKTKAKEILKELEERLIFSPNKVLRSELEEILKYDFDPTSENANQHIVRVFEHIAKSPEFQLI
ncbi:MAG: DUF1800 family protein [Leadbetterella sp.]